MMMMPGGITPLNPSNTQKGPPQLMVVSKPKSLKNSITKKNGAIKKKFVKRPSKRKDKKPAKKKKNESNHPIKKKKRSKGGAKKKKVCLSGELLDMLVDLVCEDKKRKK